MHRLVLVIMLVCMVPLLHFYFTHFHTNSIEHIIFLGGSKEASGSRAASPLKCAILCSFCPTSQLDREAAAFLPSLFCPAAREQVSSGDVKVKEGCPSSAGCLEGCSSGGKGCLV
jgi:hypothetical protein